MIAGRDEAYKNTIDTACKALQDLPSGWDSKAEGDEGAVAAAPVPDPTHHQTLPPSPKQGFLVTPNFFLNFQWAKRTCCHCVR